MIPKPSKSSLYFFCVLLGMGYFNAFSSIDMNPLLKSYLALVPVQIGCVIYFLWFRRNTLKD